MSIIGVGINSKGEGEYSYLPVPQQTHLNTIHVKSEFDKLLDEITPMPDYIRKECVRMMMYNNVLQSYNDYKVFLREEGFKRFVVVSFKAGSVTLLIEHHFFSVRRLMKIIDEMKPVGILVIVEKPKWWEFIKDYI